MESDSLLLLHFMYQCPRNAKKQRALNCRRQRMHLLLHQLNQNMRRLQMLLLAVARVVNPRLDREFWIIPRPGVGWFEVNPDTGRNIFACINPHSCDLWKWSSRKYTRETLFSKMLFLLQSEWLLFYVICKS